MTALQTTPSNSPPNGSPAMGKAPCRKRAASAGWRFKANARIASLGSMP
jgi:hypothetical protein